MAELSLAAKIEALLFASAEPMTATSLARATQEKPGAIAQALALLRDQKDRGIVVAEDNNRYYLVTNPMAASVVSTLETEPPTRDLSAAAIETLAIIAYRGPITKNFIDQQRGVSSESIIRSLLARDLIAEHDRTTEPGRPIRYRTTSTFLAYFGLTSLKDLPSLPKDPEPAHAR